jgi:starch synthase
MSDRTLRVLSVASEAYPLVKTGGLADVVGALPRALAREDVSVRTLLPGYPAVLAAMGDARVVHEYRDLMGGPARLLAGEGGGLDLVAIEAPHLYRRTGNPYLDAQGRDWSDNALRFGALARVAADIGRGLLPDSVPDVLHAHDWQAALLPAYLAYEDGARPATVLTIHNLAFQGQFPADLLEPLGLPPRAFHVDGVEYYGGIGYLKAGLALADRITTVSPTYAAEIRTNLGGMGLGGLLQKRGDAVSGILNGIDTDVWDPAHDAHLAASFDAKRLAARAIDKAALQARLGLDAAPKALLYGVVSRLTHQKGMDLVRRPSRRCSRRGPNSRCSAPATRRSRPRSTRRRAHPGRVAAVIGYEEALAHLVQGGADALLVPSRFEPCGLTQLCALRYGAIPVVTRVGGLADTVDRRERDGARLRYRDRRAVRARSTRGAAIEFARRAALALKRDPAWRAAAEANAMATDVAGRGPPNSTPALPRARRAPRQRR